MTKIITVASGSSGNCYIVETAYNGGLRERLIIDAGVPFNAVKRALKFDLRNLNGCLISHEHNDHALYAKQVAEQRIGIYATQGTLQNITLPEYALCVGVATKEPFNIGSFNVMAFRTEHDAAQPCGFLIDCPDGNRIVFATDTYYLKYKFPNVNIYMIECNYEEMILRRNIKDGTVPLSVGNRVRRSHMSLAQCCTFLTSNDLTKTKAILLLHLSKDNSNAAKFVDKVEKVTGKPTFVASKNFDLFIGS